MDENIKEMNNEELKDITGGAGGGQSNTVQAFCPFCNKKTTFIVYSGSRGKCQSCGNVTQV